METANGFLPPSKDSRVSSSNIIGWFPTLKNGKGSLARYRSTIERDFLYFLEFDQNVVSYRTQPGKIKSWAFKGEVHYYTPDVEVIHKTHKELIECKPATKLNSEHTLQQITIGQQYCHENGYLYRLVTDQELRAGARLENYKMIYRYSRKRVPMPTIESLKDFFSTCPSGAYLYEILGFLSGFSEDNQYLPVVLSLLFSKFLDTNYDIPLWKSSLIWLNIAE